MSEFGWDKSKTTYILKDKHYFLSNYGLGFKWHKLEKIGNKWKVSPERFPELGSKEEAIKYLEEKILK